MLAMAATCIALATAGSCGGDPSGESATPAARVYVLAIDGASWPVLDLAMDAGVMPNLHKLVDGGARGPLRSMDPTASAILWTTIATGRNPEDHGIRGFVARSSSGKAVPVTSNLRRVKALWNIAGESGLTVGFLGWWVTWPAEEVRGFMATDYTWPLQKDPRGFATGVNPDLDLPGRTYPPDLIDRLEPYNRIESRINADELEALGIAAVPPTRGYAIRDMLLKDISLASMMEPLLDDFDPDLFAIYFDGFDAFCHIFWPTYRAYITSRARDASSSGISARERALGRALDLHLGRIDKALGRLVELAGPDDVVLVISDHGYGDNPGRRPVLRGYGEWIRPPHWHTLDGIIAATGGPIRSGAEIHGAGVLDVAPTILAMLGLPVAEDMDGRVLEEMLTDAFLSEHPVRQIATYETGPRGEAEALESEYDDEVLERLRSLGYID